MLVNSLTNERTQVVSVNSSWGGVSQKPKGQWLSKSWAVFPILAKLHLHRVLLAAVHCKGTQEKGETSSR